jgi:rhodanese-related sulfurtransferase
MKRTIALTLFGILVCSLVGLAAPKITVDNPVYDFGNVVEGNVVTHTFVLTNAGDQPLSISQVVTSCGCTTTTLTNKTVAPGESVPMQVALDTRGFGGQTLVKLIKIVSNDPVNTTLVLQMKGTVLRAKPYNIAVGDLTNLIYILIDLRSPQAYAAGHLIGAINIPYAELSQWTDRLPKDVLIILYSADGSVSDQAAQTLIADGFVQAKSLLGGMAEWTHVYHDRFILSSPTGE